jgi:peptidoglycan-N-acetylglucosamine deacetylase
MVRGGAPSPFGESMNSQTVFRTARMLGVLAVAAGVSAAHAQCGPDALGTARTLILKREGGAFGTPQHGPLPLQKGEVVLTFDDGPRAETTPQVLKALADQCVKATFFLVGTNMEKNAALAQRIRAEGHSTGLHSYTHTSQGTLSASDQLADLKKTEDAYRAVFGVTPPAYRFPYLAETPTLLSTLASRNMTVMSVDLAINDWEPDVSTALLVQRLRERLKEKGGGIILMHDVFDATAAAMPALLKVLKDDGYRVVHLEWAKED